jgi:hypothetical protein
MISEPKEILTEGKTKKGQWLLTAQTTLPVDTFDNSCGIFCGRASIFLDKFSSTPDTAESDPGEN